jgi:hypothetical protein
LAPDRFVAFLEIDLHLIFTVKDFWAANKKSTFSGISFVREIDEYRDTQFDSLLTFLLNGEQCRREIAGMYIR